MQQYYLLKEQYKDCVLFFRIWDFYEMFWEDAQIANRVLWINITSRNKNAINPEALAWIPFHAKEKYLSILVNSWYKVAIAEQVSDPKLKWIVKREVVRVVTPATLTMEQENYNLDISNILLSICFENNKYWFTYIDSSNNKIYTWELNSLDSLISEISRLWAKEIIIDKININDDFVKKIEKFFWLSISFIDNINKYYEFILKHFDLYNLIWFWIEDKILSQKSIYLLLKYLKTNQFNDLKYIKELSYINYDYYLLLDDASIKSLDIFYNFSIWSKSKGTLISSINKSKTAMWKRFLYNALLRPLQDIEEIKKRHNFIEELSKDKILFNKIKEKLKYINDIDNILMKLSLKRILAIDLLNLKNSLINIIEIENLLTDKLKTYTY